MAQQSVQTMKRMERSVLERVRQLFVVMILVGTLVGVVTGIYFTHKGQVAAQTAFEMAKLEQDKVIAKQRRIAKDYQRVQDPDYIAGLARRDYYYSKPGELIFELEDATQSMLYDE